MSDYKSFESSLPGDAIYQHSLERVVIPQMRLEEKLIEQAISKDQLQIYYPTENTESAEIIDLCEERKKRTP